MSAAVALPGRIITLGLHLGFAAEYLENIIARSSVVPPTKVPPVISSDGEDPLVPINERDCNSKEKGHAFLIAVKTVVRDL